MTEFYNLVRASNKFWSLGLTQRDCRICGDIISNKGGPGKSLCISCGDALIAKRLRGMWQDTEDNVLILQLRQVIVDYAEHRHDCAFLRGTKEECNCGLADKLKGHL